MREWTGLEFAKSQRAVENGAKWRKLVAKSSVVPQRPSQFKGKMMMMMMKIGEVVFGQGNSFTNELTHGKVPGKVASVQGWSLVVIFIRAPLQSFQNRTS